MGSRYKTVGNTVVSETNFKLYVLTKKNHIHAYQTT